MKGKIINNIDNYYYRGPQDTRQIGHIIRKMLLKNKDERSTIENVEFSISMFVSWFLFIIFLTSV